MSLSRSRRLIASVARIALVLLVIFGLVWGFGIRMPKRNISTAAALDESEMALRVELKADVQKLAGEIGERRSDSRPHYIWPRNARTRDSYSAIAAL